MFSYKRGEVRTFRRPFRWLYAGYAGKDEPVKVTEPVFVYLTPHPAPPKKAGTHSAQGGAESGDVALA